MLKPNSQISSFVGLFLVAVMLGLGLRLRQEETQNVVDEQSRDVQNELSTSGVSNDHRKGVISSFALLEEYKEVRNSSSARATLAELSVLRQGPLSPLSRARIDFLIAAGAKSCPEELLEFLLQPESKLLQRTGMPTLFAVWASSNKQGALGAIHDVESLRLRRTLELRLLLGLAKHDPELALTVIQKNSQIDESEGENLVSIYFEAFLRLGNTDFEAALERFSSIEGRNEREMALMGLAASAAQKDFGAAFDFWCRSALDANTKRKMLPFILRRGILVNGQKALDEFEVSFTSGGLDSPDVLSCISSNLPELVGLDFFKTFEMIDAAVKMNPEGSGLLVECFEEFCRRNPSKAAEVFKELDLDFSFEQSNLGEVIEKRMKIVLAEIGIKTNPENYRELLEGVDLNMSDELGRMTSHLLDTQGASFASFLMEQSKKGLSEYNLEFYLSSWISHEPDLAYQWVEESLPRGNLKETLTLSYDMGRALKNSGEYGYELLESEYSDSNRKLTEFVGGILTSDSPPRAAKWAKGLSDELLQKQAVDVVSKGWVRADSYAAGEWIRSLPKGDARKIAIRNLVDAIKEVDPISAQEWEESISE